jgi:hypothetical protein
VVVRLPPLAAEEGHRREAGCRNFADVLDTLYRPATVNVTEKPQPEEPAGRNMDEELERRAVFREPEFHRLAVVAGKPMLRAEAGGNQSGDKA